MGPKKSRKNLCPNPLFLLWLEEWRKEAEEKEMQSKWTYAKAIASIKKYPLPLRSGKEAKILENIGDGIAKKLDARLSEHIKNGGDLKDLHYIEPDIQSSSPRKRKPKSTTDSSMKTGEPVFSPNAKYLKTNSGTYVPKHRSGGYALLIALYQESQTMAYLGFMNKNELQELAQPLCDSSFIVSDGNSHYTAWSSMGTLIEKGFVIKRSSPAKYFITDKGCELAHNLIQGTVSSARTPIKARKPIKSPQQNKTITTGKTIKTLNECDEDNPLLPFQNTKSFGNSINFSTAASHLDNTKGQRLGGRTIDPLSPNGYFSQLQNKINAKSLDCSEEKNDDIAENFGTVNLDETYEPLKEFVYWYVKENGETTLSKSQALVTIDDTIGLGFLVKANLDEIQSSGVLFKLDRTRDSIGPFTFAYLADKDARECPRPPNGNIDLVHTHTSAVAGTLWSTTNKISSNRSAVPAANSSSSISSISTTAFSLTKTETCNRLKKETSVSNAHILFSLLPGLFDVILCVDATETTGSSKKKKELANKLSQCVLNMEVRKLPLGDFLWIARERIGRKREVVLDFIMERKRIDDLASSIIDGRYKEQKYRLKRCGLKKLIYLVESHGSAEHLPIPLSTLRQAIMNTQIVDGLFVKETNNVFETVEYIALLTEYLANFYKTKSLHATDMDFVKNLKETENVQEMLEKQEHYVMTYESYAQNTEKNQMLTVREMFVKQLIQIKGVSVDKAVAIVNVYSTPLCLLTALESVGDLSERETMLANITFGKTKSKIGPSISRQIVTLFTKMP